MIAHHKSAYEAVTSVIQELHLERGDPLPLVSPDSPLSSFQLESLDIASLVVRLEESLGTDPFASGRITVFPRTVAELVKLYEG